MSEYALRRISTMLLNAVIATSVKLANVNKDTTEEKARAEQREEARIEQQKVAKKVVARFGINTVFEALAIYKHALLESVKAGKLRMRMKKDGKELSWQVPCYSYGIDEYFRSRWPESWKGIIEKVKKKRTEIAKKTAEKAKKSE